MESPPILLLVYNRPELTKHALDRLSEVKPRRLYIAADGPKNAEDAIKCDEVRRLVSSVDWDCELTHLLRNRNLGLREAVSGAITWFFSHEVEGIILEDDCLPSKSFFQYCADLLDRYRHDQRIMCISGVNYHKGKNFTDYSYFFSRYNHCWGWATWKRAWDLYDSDMDQLDDFNDKGLIRALSYSEENFEKYYKAVFDLVKRKQINSWAFVWTFSCFFHNGLTCLPSRNLVSNIGFGPDGTHTKNVSSSEATMEIFELDFPLKHPKCVIRNIDADLYTDQCVHRTSKYFPTIGKRIKGMVRKAIGLLKWGVSKLNRVL